MTINRPTLSVTIANYNHARYLPDALHAIAEQSLLPDELIILDDASTDNSLEIISAFAEKHAFVKVVRNPENMGAIFSVKRNLDMATGDLIHIHSADDMILPGMYEQSVRMLAQHREAGLCSSISLLCNEAGEDKGLFSAPIVSGKAMYLGPDQVRQTLLRYGGWFMGNTVVYRREALLKEGGLRSELGPFVDGFACHALALRYGACYIPKAFGVWRRLDSGVSSSACLDLDRMRDMVAQSTSLMLDDPTYEGLFPRAYVRAWGKRQKYWVATAIQKSTEQRHLEFLNRLFRIENGHSPRKVLTRLIVRMVMGIRSLCVGAFLLLRSFTWPSSVLMLNWLGRHLAHRVTHAYRKYP